MTITCGKVRLRNDGPTGFVVELLRGKRKDGEDNWQGEWFYGRLDQAVQRFADVVGANADDGVAEFLAEYRAVAERIAAAVGSPAPVPPALQPAKSRRHKAAKEPEPAAAPPVDTPPTEGWGTW